MTSVTTSTCVVTTAGTVQQGTNSEMLHVVTFNLEYTRCITSILCQVMSLSLVRQLRLIKWMEYDMQGPLQHLADRKLCKKTAIYQETPNSSFLTNWGEKGKKARRSTDTPVLTELQGEKEKPEQLLTQS